MTRYRHAFVTGANYFFTVNLAARRTTLLIEHIGLLREAIRYARWRHPFAVDAMVVLPDHPHVDRLGVELPLVPYGQVFKDMSPARGSLEAGLLNGRIRHGTNPVLTMCAANAVVTKDPAGSHKTRLRQLAASTGCRRWRWLWAPLAQRRFRWRLRTI